MATARAAVCIRTHTVTGALHSLFFFLFEIGDFVTKNKARNAFLTDFSPALAEPEVFRLSDEISRLRCKIKKN